MSEPIRDEEDDRACSLAASAALDAARAAIEAAGVAGRWGVVVVVRVEDETPDSETAMTASEDDEIDVRATMRRAFESVENAHGNTVQIIDNSQN